MENFTKTIAEVKSALDQATQMLEERTEHMAHIKNLQELNAQLLKEAQSNDNDMPNTQAKRELKVLEMAFKAGRDQVLGQLRNQSYGTTHEIDESTYSDGFEIQFTQEVEIEICFDSIIDECYEEEDMDSDDFQKLQEEIRHTLDSQLETETVKI